MLISTSFFFPFLSVLVLRQHCRQRGSGGVRRCWRRPPQSHHRICTSPLTSNIKFITGEKKVVEKKRKLWGSFPLSVVLLPLFNSHRGAAHTLLPPSLRGCRRHRHEHTVHVFHILYTTHRQIQLPGCAAVHVRALLLRHCHTAARVGPLAVFIGAHLLS